MTDWEKLKVVDLKEELKSRGVSLSGLKLKQQLIDKLNELDANAGSEEAQVEASKNDSQDEQTPIDENSRRPSEEEEESLESEMREPGSESADVQIESGSTTKAWDQAMKDSSDDVRDKKQNYTRPNKELEDNTQDIQPAPELPVSAQTNSINSEIPTELKKEENQARDGVTPPPIQAKTEADRTALQRDNPFILQGIQEEQQEPINAAHSVETTETADPESAMTSVLDVQPSREGISIDEESQSTSELATSIQQPPPEVSDDQRKRKRRSLTPTPDADEIVHKKSKTNDGTPVPTKMESRILEKVQEATNAAQAIRDPQSSHHIQPEEEAQEGHGPAEAIVMDKTQEREQTNLRSSPPSSSEHNNVQSPSRSSSDRDIAPAIHPATCSLYIRNFKRPLHIPSLRSHISTLAKSWNEDPVKVFYLDSIRTHAFITFASISAASGVRNAMHGTRFPDEPMREPLWIDFAPDENIQAWIDQESTGSGSGFGGGRGYSKKYEVVYHNNGNGVKAILQETTNTSTQSHRLDLPQSRSNRVAPQESTSSTALPPGSQLSRVAQTQQSPPSSRVQHQRLQPPPRPSDPGRGFRALDELFSSTTAKPKLYFKLPPQSQVDERQEMMRDLRVSHDQMGKSGDEGMKRYTFEHDERSGREEWVDKGPEFGFGRRGQERLTGFGTSYGRGRGRGGFRGGRRGGNSWRGS